MKKILLLIDSLTSGGAQRQIVGLAELLKDTGYQIKLADYWEINFYDKYLAEKNIEFEHRVAKGKLNIFKAIYKLIGEFRPDVVISYLEHPSSIACLVKILHLTHPFKLIVSERNTTQTISTKDRVRFSLFRWGADKIVSNSYTQAEFIKNHYPSLYKKTCVITNYLDTNRFTPQIGKNINTDRPFRFIVVGRVVEQKNPINFLKALAIVKEKNPGRQFVVDWYGVPHPQTYLDKCINLVEKLGLEAIVHFYPPTQDIIKEYQTSDCFILPSLYEGFPNVLCEAMSCGLPVAASDICDNPSILDNGKLGLLFNPQSIEDIASKMVTILNMNTTQILQMGENCRRAAVEKFSHENFIKSYISLINKQKNNYY